MDAVETEIYNFTFSVNLKFEKSISYTNINVVTPRVYRRDHLGNLKIQRYQCSVFDF
jgi:hypothetical protein